MIFLWGVLHLASLELAQQAATLTKLRALASEVIPPDIANIKENDSQSRSLKTCLSIYYPGVAWYTYNLGNTYRAMDRFVLRVIILLELSPIYTYNATICYFFPDLLAMSISNGIKMI